MENPARRESYSHKRDQHKKVIFINNLYIQIRSYHKQLILSHTNAFLNILGGSILRSYNRMHLALVLYFQNWAGEKKEVVHKRFWSLKFRPNPKIMLIRKLSSIKGVDSLPAKFFMTSSSGDFL